MLEQISPLAVTRATDARLPAPGRVVGNGAIAASHDISASSTGSESRARAAATDFEAVFLTEMLEHMFAGISTDGPFGGGHAEGIYRSLMLQEYGQAMARSGGIGLADELTAEILRIQESQQNAPSQ